MVDRPPITRGGRRGRRRGWYSNAGYALLDRNWRCREGELDLVVARDRAVVFCEVKTRRGAAFGAPFEAVTLTKQRRLFLIVKRVYGSSRGGVGEKCL